MATPIELVKFARRYKPGRSNFWGMLPEVESQNLQNILPQILRQTQTMQEEEPSIGASIGSAISGGIGMLGQDRGHDGASARGKYEGNEHEMSQLPATADITKQRMAMRDKNPFSGIGGGLTNILSGKTAQEIERRENKDFSKGGADYDKDHDWKDALRSAGLGVLKGLANADPRMSLGQMIGTGLGGGVAGGIGGAIDRNADEKMGNEIALNRLYPQYGKQLEKAKAEQDISERQSRIKDRETDNLRMQKDLERKIRKDEETAKYWNNKIDQGKLRLANDEKLTEIRDRLAQSKDENDRRRLDLVEKEMENRMIRADKDRESREKIAGQREEGANRRQQITIEAQKEAARIRELEANGRQQEAIAARERLAKLQAEYNSLQ